VGHAQSPETSWKRTPIAENSGVHSLHWSRHVCPNAFGAERSQIAHVGRVKLGTSGFVYSEWRGLFYPEKLPARLWLDYYTRVFSTVELNTTFYRLPKADAVRRWKEDSPKGFEFVAKGSRYITHMKRLTEPKEPVRRYFEPLTELGRKLHTVLWQLPPNMTRPDPKRLDGFLRALPRRYAYVFEFRHDDWHHEEVMAVLDAHGVAVCEHDLVSKPPPRVTGGFRYLRFHGATGKYNGRYKKRRLEPVAEELRDWTRQGQDAYVFFNNDRFGHAILDALTLSELLGEPVDLPEEAPRFARQSMS
jgi:uncharacterized protein YecE (DUF72 family)